MNALFNRNRFKLFFFNLFKIAFNYLNSLREIACNFLRAQNGENSMKIACKFDD